MVRKTWLSFSPILPSLVRECGTLVGVTRSFGNNLSRTIFISLYMSSGSVVSCLLPRRASPTKVSKIVVDWKRSRSLVSLKASISKWKPSTPVWTSMSLTESSGLRDLTTGGLKVFLTLQGQTVKPIAQTPNARGSSGATDPGRRAADLAACAKSVRRGCRCFGIVELFPRKNAFSASQGASQRWAGGGWRRFREAMRTWFKKRVFLETAEFIQTWTSMGPWRECARAIRLSRAN